MKLASAYATRLRRHYGPLVRAHGATHRAVDWGSERGQETRFRMLLEPINLLEGRLLDVGCGVGHLVDHLKTRRFGGEYLGLDLVPEMVMAAQGRHRGWNFREGRVPDDALAFEADYVIGSGLFNLANQKTLEDTVAGMFRVARRMVAFNSLSAWGDNPVRGEFRADPVKVVEFCRKLTRRVVLRHDYLPHDFTVYLYREDAAS
jgi:SAM-dependent methyltransferase